jgi:hypothetical protein
MKSKLVGTLSVLALTALWASQAIATPVMFDFSGSDPGGFTATGSFTIDDSLFDGTTFQKLSNTNITALSFTGNTPGGPIVFGTSDIDPTGATFFDSSVSPVTVPNGAGLLATLPGFGLAIVGNDTTLLIGGIPSLGYVGVWTEATPAPSSLSLLGTGIALMVLLMWRRKPWLSSAPVSSAS